MRARALATTCSSPSLAVLKAGGAKPTSRSISPCQPSAWPSCSPTAGAAAAARTPLAAACELRRLRRRDRLHRSAGAAVRPGEAAVAAVAAVRRAGGAACAAGGGESRQGDRHVGLDRARRSAWRPTHGAPRQPGGVATGRLAGDRRGPLPATLPDPGLRRRGPGACSPYLDGRRYEPARAGPARRRGSRRRPCGAGAAARQITVISFVPIAPLAEGCSPRAKRRPRLRPLAAPRQAAATRSTEARCALLHGALPPPGPSWSTTTSRPRRTIGVSTPCSCGPELQCAAGARTAGGQHAGLSARPATCCRRRSASRARSVSVVRGAGARLPGPAGLDRRTLQSLIH